MTGFQYLPMHFYVPLDVYGDEATFAGWLQSHCITGFFWEALRYKDWVVIEVIDP